ncbi:MAG: class I SAM-dependent methyltransferase [Planctomycetes bacterium]|nr:class I SAM-dependent methyltransferase [Planctomycetota bacterium]
MTEARFQPLRETIKRFVRQIPIVGDIAFRAASRLIPKRTRQFLGSADYWENRYKSGGNSGRGSYDLLADFKAEVLNDFVRKHAIHAVIEFGCGDGNQLLLARYPSYRGYDVSRNAIDRCRLMFANDATKSFHLLNDYRGETADLVISLDVVYHLVEDVVYAQYMERLFDAGRRFVVIYSSNFESQPTHEAPHVRHRRFTDWIDENRPAWHLVQHVPNRYPIDGKTGEGSFADFHFYQLDANH